MIVWWAAFFVIGTTVPERPECILWGGFAALLPLVCDHAHHGRGDPVRRGRLRRAVLTAVTGCLVCQYASGASCLPCASRRGRDTGPRAPVPVEALRDHVRSVCSSPRLSRTSRGMLPALLLADRTALDPAVRDLWRRLGIAHFLALSGLHLGIVALPLYRLLSILRLRGAVREAAAFLVLSWYAAAAGAPLSLMRAASLLFIVRAHRLAGRPVMRDEALASGAFVVCLFIPRSVGDPGFALSVCAAAGVLLVGAPLGARIAGRGGGFARRAAGYPAAALCVSVSAMLYTMPPVLVYFGRAPICGPLLSIVLAPVVTVFLYAGFFYAAIGHLLGSAGAAPLNLIASVMTSIPRRFPAPQSAAVVRGDMNGTVFIAGAVALAAALSRGRPKRRLAAAGILAMTCSFIIGSIPRRSASGRGCDTLLAGAALDRRRSTLLVEGALSPGRAAVIYRRLLDRGVRSIERTIITGGCCLSARGFERLGELIPLGRVIVSPWLLECDDMQGSTAKARLEPLHTPVRVEFGDDVLIISGPRRPPGARGVFTEDDTELRISPLDSGGV